MLKIKDYGKARILKFIYNLGERGSCANRPQPNGGNPATRRANRDGDSERTIAHKNCLVPTTTDQLIGGPDAAHSGKSQNDNLLLAL